MTTENQAAVPTAPKTREEKLRDKAAMLRARIEADTEKYHEVTNELNNITALASIREGAIVIVKLGRKFADKDTTRFEQATVVAVREEEDGSKQYKVQYGEGWDAEVAVVGASAISLPQDQ